MTFDKHTPYSDVPLFQIQTQKSSLLVTPPPHTVAHLSERVRPPISGGRPSRANKEAQRAPDDGTAHDALRARIEHGGRLDRPAQPLLPTAGVAARQEQPIIEDESCAREDPRRRQNQSSGAGCLH